jgi:hypothetical protein
VLIVDPPHAWGTNAQSVAAIVTSGLSSLGLDGAANRNAALYFPRLIARDPLRGGQLATFVPSGAVAE